jgi:hypothetical protein
MNRISIALALAVFFPMFGCQDNTEADDGLWNPSTKQIEEAKIVALKYAEKELEVPKDILKRVKCSAYGFYKNGNKIIYMEFHDPQFFPNWENMAGVLGGFPHYYTISIDSKKIKVVDSYASPE